MPRHTTHAYVLSGENHPPRSILSASTVVVQAPTQVARPVQVIQQPAVLVPVQAARPVQVVQQPVVIVPPPHPVVPTVVTHRVPYVMQSNPQVFTVVPPQTVQGLPPAPMPARVVAMPPAIGSQARIVRRHP